MYLIIHYISNSHTSILNTQKISRLHVADFVHHPHLPLVSNLQTLTAH